MRRAYLFIYNADVGSHETIKSVLDAMQGVYTWRFDIPNCFYVVSDHGAQELFDEFVQHNGSDGRFMFIEAGTNRQGMMLRDTWHLLTHKTHRPEE